MLHCLRFLLLLATIYGSTSFAAEDAGSLPELALSQISDRSFMPLGQAALGIRAADWKHAESGNFIYHYFHSFIAAPVAVEAEFYYRIIAQELEKDTTRWERKSHIFVFETAADWSEFQQRGALDPWTGGIHSHGELFIRRDPQFRFKGNALGHEIAHLVVDRFFGSNVPLWQSEGFAEDVSIRGYAAFQRARNYRMHPSIAKVAQVRFIPLADLTAAVAYPQDVLQVHTFYQESEQLTRFLRGTNKASFGVFFDQLSKGARFETALSRGYGSRFDSMQSLEREFKASATEKTE